MEKIADEFDPLTNVRTRTGFVDDKLVVRVDSDISQNIEYATALRNSDQYSSDGIKKGFMHACHVPAEVVVELLHIGVDVFRATPREIIAGLRSLHKDYLITTRKRV